MMNFNFRLERVLNYKETVEDYKKGEYGAAQKKLNDEENKLNHFNQYKNNLKDEKNTSAAKTKAGNLAMYNNYINDVTKKIIKQEEMVTRTKKELEDAKEEMITAVQEKKSFEKLKENEYREHLYQLKKFEEKQTDTIVSYKTSTQQ
jgi:flagellar FliJ protein